MLALMAGRMAREGFVTVIEGRVSITCLKIGSITHTAILVATI